MMGFPGNTAWMLHLELHQIQNDIHDSFKLPLDQPWQRLQHIPNVSLLFPSLEVHSRALPASVT
jgi:hypothetical protein